MLTRREFIQTTGVLVASGLLPRSLFAQNRPEPLQARQLRESIWVVTGGGGNSLLARTAGGPLVIDTKVAPRGSELLAMVADLAGERDFTILNTHHHQDHIGGNYQFHSTVPSHLTIIAHDHLKPRIDDALDRRIRPALLEAAEGSENADALTAEANALTSTDFWPTTEFARELSIDRGAIQLRLHHHGNGHTDNDTIVFLPAQNILHMGDLIFHKLHPYIDHPGGADTISWQRVLREAEAYCDEDTVVIPGHGEIADHKALPLMYDYFDQLREIVTGAITAGSNREEITGLKPAAFADLGFAGLQAKCLGDMYDELADES